MKHYIDKSALVAELERRTDELYALLPDSNGIIDGSIIISTEDACNTGKYVALESFKDYIDALEVKEINSTDAFIEKAADAYCRLCDTKECGGIGECFWVKKFRNYMKGE